MPLSLVAIVGRPNVGKSSLFNALAREQISIVDPTAGVTRDRVSTFIEESGRFFELVDTGGMGIKDSDNLTDQVEAQISYAIAAATLLIFVLDVREGITPLDNKVAERLRHAGKPVIVVANKAESEKTDSESAAFYGLGLGEPLLVSAKEGRNRGLLVERILELLPPPAADDRLPQADMTVAIVGKRNAGKSTFINSLAGQERVIVSEVPGTTRDSVDIRIEKDGLTYVVIDTAGLRKRSSVKGDIEFYSRVRAERAIRRADISLLFLDAIVPIGTVDQHLGRFIMDTRKPVVIVVNKWDEVKGRASTGDFADYIGRELTGLDFAPITFISSINSQNTLAALDVARSVFKQAHTRVSTGRINKALDEATRRRKPPSGKQGGLVKIYYGTQVAVDPPTITLFANDPDNVSTAYVRYLVHQFRELLPFAETPLRLLFRRSGGDDQHPAARAKAHLPKTPSATETRARASSTQPERIGHGAAPRNPERRKRKRI